jgi:hypothetical protein
MTDAPLARSLALALVAVTAGLAFGLAYFAVLRRTIDLYGAGGGRIVPAALTLGRVAGAILFLGFAARLGALPLMTVFGGFLLARSLALRAVRTTA